jgi:hypothetical protein
MADPKELGPSGEQQTQVTIPAPGAAAEASAGAAEFWKKIEEEIPMEDVLYQSGVTATQPTPEAGLKEVGLSVKENVVRNDQGGGGPSILINSDRVIINSRAGHTIVAGSAGVALTSPSKVNIDADDSVTVFGSNGFFLGIPNKGVPYKPEDYPSPAMKKEGVTMKKGKPLKSMPTSNTAYEPVVLGIKLANWLDDLLQVLRNAQLLTPVGLGAFREDTLWDFSALSIRIKEMLSTYAYVDGWSHEQPDIDLLGKAPTEVTKPRTTIEVENQVNLQPPLNTQDPNINKPGFYDGTDLGGISISNN